jgi:putative membrane protein
VIIKHNLSPLKIVPYVWIELLVIGALAVAVWLGSVALPFAPLGVLGMALAIFLGFRNNSGYARWWDARSSWATLVNSSRNLGRLVASSVDNAGKLGKGGGDEALAAYKREVLYRQIAFAHALRLQLRGQDRWDVLAPLLPAAELERVRGAANKPNVIMQVQADRLRDGVREEKLGQFDPISLEPTLASFVTVQGNCERIKGTPLLRQYEFFTRVFLWTFLLLLPSSLLGLFASADRWAAIPLTLAITFIYVITNKIGKVTEDPFENSTHDVPMTALCNTVERDLREQLGERDLPPAAQPVDGYLY